MKTLSKLTLALAVCLAACTGTKKGYEVTGTIEGAGDGVAVLAVYADREVAATDTVKMTAGKFEFAGVVPDVRNAVVTVVPDGEQAASLSFIIENSPIAVSARWADVVEQYGSRRFGQSTVTGSRNNDFMSSVNKVYDDMRNRPEHQEYVRMYDEAMKLREAGQTDEYYKLSEQMAPLAQRYKEDVDKARKAVVAANTDLPVAANYLVFLQADMSLEELESMFNAFTEEVRNSEMADLIRQEIEARKRVRPGQPAPDFTLAQPDGTKLALSELKGKVVILDFWASWCQPCRASFPAMMEFYNKYKDKGVEILGVSNDSNHDAWRKAIEDDGITWRQVVDEFPVQNRPAKVATLYAIPYLPTLVLIDQQGTIVAHNIAKNDLEARVNDLLGL